MKIASSNHVLVSGVAKPFQWTQSSKGRFSSPPTTSFVSPPYPPDRVLVPHGTGATAHPGIHPINRVGSPGGSAVTLPIFASLILAGRGFSRGRCPVSGFRWMVKVCKLLRSFTHSGNSPDSMLFARANHVSPDKSPSSDGISPDSMLFWSCSRWRLERLPSSFGIDPVSMLLPRNSSWRLERLPSSFGIDPVSMLSVKCSCRRLERLPSSFGIDPVSIASVTTRYRRLARLPSSFGIDPVNACC